MKRPFTLPLKPRHAEILKKQPIAALVGLVAFAFFVIIAVALFYGAGLVGIRLNIGSPNAFAELDLGVFGQTLLRGINVVSAVAILVGCVWILLLALAHLGRSVLERLRIVPEDED